MPPSMTPALQTSNLSKTFGATRALTDLTLKAAPGEVHVLLGQNGSGKSTLIKILSGYHIPDPGGSVSIMRTPLTFGSPSAAYRLGCRFVHQDLGLIASETVRDNILVGSGFPSRFATISNRHANEIAASALARVGARLDPRRPVRGLSASERTGVALARALRDNPEYPPSVVILDEPTSTLTHQEADQLLVMIATAASNGVAVLFVTHDLDEAMTVGHRVSVLRDGRLVWSSAVDAVDRRTLAVYLGAEMTARGLEIEAEQRAGTGGTGPQRLTVAGLSATVVRDCSLTVRAGEVVGIAGLTGSGRDEILGAIFGAFPRSGTVSVGGKTVAPHRPDLSIAAGLAYLPSDRQERAGHAGLPAYENISLTNLRAFWRRLLVRHRQERRNAAVWFSRLMVRPADVSALLSTFSGGNQQKILLAKWLQLEPAVLLLDDPTQGVDVVATAQLHEVLLDLARSGAAILVSSSDLEELSSICERVLVMRGGRITVKVEGSDISPSRLKSELIG
jgi:ribose transport system ATP-binding protein